MWVLSKTILKIAFLPFKINLLDCGYVTWKSDLDIAGKKMKFYVVFVNG